MATDARRRVAAAAVLAAAAAGSLRAQPTAPVAALLVAALDAMQARQPRSVSVHVRMPGIDVTQTWDVISARRYRFVQTPPGGSIEFVVWDDNAWLRSGAGWMRKQLNAVPVAIGGGDWLRAAVARAVADAVQLPDDRSGGVTLRHYAATLASHDALGPYAGRVELWLDAATPLPLRSTFAGTYAGRPVTIETRVDYAATPSFAPPQPVPNPP